MSGRMIGAVLGALILAVAPALAADYVLPFTLRPGTFLHFAVEHHHRDMLAGRPLPEVVTRCSIRVSVDSADKNGSVVLIHVENTDQTIDGERGPPPADRRSLLLLSIATVVARVNLSVDGVPLRVTNWADLRDGIAERARMRAGGNAGLAALAGDYIAGLDENTAVALLAEPLALAAAGRSATFDPPDETLLIRGGMRLPSFLPSLWADWAFTLADDAPSPDVVTVAWEGVAGRPTLAPFLPMLATEIGGSAAGAPVDLSDQAATARQVFRADYSRSDGTLVALTGTMTLTAGPLVRTETIEIKAVP